MLIDLHAHHISAGMLNRDEHWGPFVNSSGLKVGNWQLGTKTWGTADDATAQIDWIERLSVERRLQVMDERRIDRLVLSVPAHMYMYWTGPFGNTYAEIVNEELAATCAEAPERLSFWGHANLSDPVAAAKEIERAVTSLGAKGMSMGGSNFGGLDASDEALDPVWEKLSELGVPVFVHGYNESVTWDDADRPDRFDTTSIVGMCSDEASLFWHIVNGGVLDRFPGLTFYITHGGGFIPYQLQRFHETNLTMAPDSKNQKPVREYMENFYFDLDLHSVAMRRAVVEDIGSDRLLYGTNFGGADSHAGDLTDGLDLPEVEREKIRSGNALRLMTF